MIWVAVDVGGALASMARYAINHWIHARWMVTRFPLGKVVVNVVGSFVIGLLAGLPRVALDEDHIGGFYGDVRACPARACARVHTVHENDRQVMPLIAVAKISILWSQESQCVGCERP